MANTIRLKSGSGSNPSASDLVVGEVALRTDGNPKLFTKNDAGNVLEVGLDSLNDKLPLTGGTITGNLILDNATNAGRDVQWQHANDRLAFFDNTKATFGAGSDLNIYHNPSSNGTNYFQSTSGNTVIQQQGNGARIRIAATNIALMNHVQNETYFHGVNNGAVELYYDNSKKFETTSGGISITGDITGTGHLDLGDDAKLKMGASDDLEIFHSGGNSFIANSTGYLLVNSEAGDNVIRASNDVYLQPAAGEFGVKATANGATELYFDNSKKFETNSTGVEVIGDILLTFANGYSLFADKSGNFLRLGDSVKLQVGNTGDLEIFHDGTDSFIKNDTGQLILRVASVESAVVCKPNGAVELYHDNSKKFETSSTGATVTGTLTATTFSGSGASLTNIPAGQLTGTLPALDGSNLTGLTVNNANTLDNLDSTQFLRSDAADTASGDITFTDNTKAKFGTGNDLEIYHNGSNSYIDNTTGNLYFRGSNGQMLFRPNNNEDALVLKPNGAVELYYDNSKKLETTSTGLYITGAAVFPDGSSNGIQIGNSSDLQIYHNGNHSKIRDVGTGNLYIESVDGNIYLRVNDNEQGVTLLENGAVELYYDNSKKLETKSTGIQVTGTIEATEHITINDNKKLFLGNSNDLQIFHDGSHSFLQNTTGLLILQDTSGIYLRTDDLRLQSDGGSETYATLTKNGAVSLNFDNSTKFETTSTGASVTGALGVGVASPTNNNKAHLRLADSSIATPSNQSVLLVENNTNTWITIGSGASSYGGILFGDSGNAGRGQVRFNHNGDIMQMIAQEEKLFQATLNGAAELYYDNSKKFETTSSGVSIPSDTTFLQIGAGQDLDLHHNGTNSYIRNKTGDLHIRPLVAEEGIILKPNGAVEVISRQQFKTVYNEFGCNS